MDFFELDEIEKRLRDITPGNWTARIAPVYPGSVVTDADWEGYGPPTIADDMSHGDARFVAAAPQDVRKLIDAFKAEHQAKQDLQEQVAGDVRAFKQIIDILADIKDDSPTAQYARNLALSRLPDAQGRTVEQVIRQTLLTTVNSQKTFEMLSKGQAHIEMGDGEASIVPVPLPFSLGQKVRLTEEAGQANADLFNRLFTVEDCVQRQGRWFVQARFGDGPNDYVDLVAEAFEAVS